MSTPATRAARDAEMQGRGFLSIPAAAKRLSLSIARTYALAADGSLQTERRGAAVFISEASIEAYQVAQKLPDGFIELTEAMERTGYSRTFFATRPDVERRHHRGRVILLEQDVERVTSGGRSGRRMMAGALQ